jgi:hypothetical protein
MWCLAHRLELVVKDALKDSVFAAVDEMLLHIYFVYEKSPKKCREHEEVASALHSCVVEVELDQSGHTVHDGLHTKTMLCSTFRQISVCMSAI